MPLPLQVLPHDELMETKKSHRHSHRKKVLPEIYLTRLLSTKVTARNSGPFCQHRAASSSSLGEPPPFSRLPTKKPHPWTHVSRLLFFYPLCLRRELFRSSWMTSFKPSSASLRTALLWLSNTSLTSWRSRLTNGASQTQTRCTSGKPTGEAH